MRSTTMASVWSAARAVMALAIVSAVVAQLVMSVDTAAGLGRDVGVTVVNFFSFFTILSNTAAALVLLWAAIWYWARGRTADAEPAALAVALTCVSTYMVVTGVVYNTLLRHIELPQGSEPIPWSNEVLHLIGPAFLLIDVFVGPRRRRLPWSAVWVVAGFPAIYTMARGPLTVNPATGAPYWYPYPFLDPNNSALEPVAGYPGVALYIVAIAAVILGIGALVVWWRRRTGVGEPGTASSPEQEPAMA
jgi:hypothetical protein